MKQKVAIIGHGTVGAALYTQLRTLPGYEVTGIAVKRPDKPAHAAVRHLLTTQAADLIDDPETGIVLEAIDDSEASLAFAKKALGQGKTYITASKKMVAGHLAVLHRLEANFGGKLLYEAAVGGAIPVVRTLREHLASEPVARIRGILNGTCNYVLTRMYDDGLSFDAALSIAQDKGYAESDPSSDVDGHDSYYKALILAHAIEKGTPQLSRVVYEGIRQVGEKDLARARKEGAKIRLVVEVVKNGERITIDIRPAMVTPSDPLFHVNGATNAVVINGGHAGELTLMGQGAGGHPTASAMVGDLVNAPLRNAEAVRKLFLALG